MATRKEEIYEHALNSIANYSKIPTSESIEKRLERLSKIAKNAIEKSKLL